MSCKELLGDFTWKAEDKAEDLLGLRWTLSLPTWLSGLKVLESGLLVFDSVTLVLDSVTWSLAFGWLCALKTFPVGNLAQGVCQCKLNLIVFS